MAEPRGQPQRSVWDRHPGKLGSSKTLGTTDLVGVFRSYGPGGPSDPSGTEVRPTILSETGRPAGVGVPPDWMTVTYGRPKSRDPEDPSRPSTSTTTMVHHCPAEESEWDRPVCGVPRTDEGPFPDRRGGVRGGTDQFPLGSRGGWDTLRGQAEVGALTTGP